MSPPGDGGMSDLICKRGVYEAKRESVDLSVRLSYSLRWSCRESFHSADKTIPAVIVVGGSAPKALCDRKKIIPPLLGH